MFKKIIFPLLLLCLALNSYATDWSTHLFSNLGNTAKANPLIPKTQTLSSLNYESQGFVIAIQNNLLYYTNFTYNSSDNTMQFSNWQRIYTSVDTMFSSINKLAYNNGILYIVNNFNQITSCDSIDYIDTTLNCKTPLTISNTAPITSMTATTFNGQNMLVLGSAENIYNCTVDGNHDVQNDCNPNNVPHQDGYEVSSALGFIYSVGTISADYDPSEGYDELAVQRCAFQEESSENANNPYYLNCSMFGSPTRANKNSWSIAAVGTQVYVSAANAFYRFPNIYTSGSYSASYEMASFANIGFVGLTGAGTVFCYTEKNPDNIDNCPNVGGDLSDTATSSITFIVTPKSQQMPFSKSLSSLENPESGLVFMAKNISGPNLCAVNYVYSESNNTMRIPPICVPVTISNVNSNSANIISMSYINGTLYMINNQNQEINCSNLLWSNGEPLSLTQCSQPSSFIQGTTPYGYQMTSIATTVNESGQVLVGFGNGNSMTLCTANNSGGNINWASCNAQTSRSNVDSDNMANFVAFAGNNLYAVGNMYNIIGGYGLSLIYSTINGNTLSEVNTLATSSSNSVNGTAGLISVNGTLYFSWQNYLNYYVDNNMQTFLANYSYTGAMAPFGNIGFTFLTGAGINFCYTQTDPTNNLSNCPVAGTEFTNNQVNAMAFITATSN